MSRLAKAIVQPMLREFRKAIADARTNGFTEEDIQAIMGAAIVEICRTVDDPEDRVWLAREFSASVRKPHQGTGTVQ